MAENGNGNGNSIRVSSLIIQIIVTVLISGASAFIGMLQGSAVIRVQMVDHEKRLGALESWRADVNQQQIEVYRSQMLLLQKQMEQQGKK